MADYQLRGVRFMRQRNMPISTVLHFTPEGLVLGAGTLLLRAEGPRRLPSLAGRESQVLALLSAAYGRAFAPSVLGNIERAAKAWNERDDCLAYVHLAHARFGELQYAHEAARRLVIVDSFLKAGGSPRMIFEALNAGHSYVDALEKDYDPQEPRVPPGSGKPSGEWTRDGGAASNEQTRDAASSGHSLLSYAAPAVRWLGELEPAAAIALGEFAATVTAAAAGAAAAFGLIFIPSRNNVRVEGEVAGIPGVHYSWNGDEARLQLTYENADGGQRTFIAQLSKDGLRDSQGRVVGRVLPDGTIAVDPAAISPDLVQEDEPRLCPAPGPDKPNKIGRDYANYVKAFVNPEPNTTPPDMGFQLANTKSGKLVFYDDCERETGTMIEAKGPGYNQLLGFSITMQSVVYEWVDEGSRQIAASGNRAVRWYFAEPAAAEFARELFRDYDEGLERIDVEVLPWTGKRQ